MSTEKKPIAPVEKNNAEKKSAEPKKSNRKEKKYYDSIMFKGIEIGYTGDLMDDENVPF